MRFSIRISVLCTTLVFLASSAFSATLIAKIRVGKEPYSPAVNPLTHRLYTANEGDSTVSVVDTTNNSLVTTIPVPMQVDHLTVNPTTNLIYVTAGHTANTVEVIDGTSNSIIATIAVGVGGFQIAVDPTINRIYTGNNTDGTVSVIDGNTNTVVDTISMPGAPTWLTADPTTDNVYVAATDSRFATSIYVISGVTGTIIEDIMLPGTLPNAVGIAIDPTTFRAYAPDNILGTLNVIDTTTFAVIGTVTGLDSCDAVAVNPSTHNILVPNDNISDNWNVAAIEDQSLQIIGKVHSPDTITGVVVDPTSGHTYLTLGNAGVAVFGP